MIYNRRKNLKTLTALMAATAVPIPKLFAKFLLKAGSSELIRNNVGLFKGKGGTIAWLINKGGICTVDSQFPDSAEEYISFAKGKSEKPFKYLINTHHHGDHSAGNIAFKDLAEQIVAHENSKTNQINSAEKRGNTASQLFPNTTFKDKWEGKTGDERITSTYFGPAHTNGDCVIHFEKANIAHVGDLVFNRRHPFIDHSAGASIKNWILVLDKIKNHYDSETIFISGHAGDGYDVRMNGSDLIIMKNYFEGLLEVVSKELKKGKSEEEILKISSIPGVKWTGENIQRPLKAAYYELSKL